MANTVKLNKNTSVDFKILEYGEILVYTDSFSTIILSDKIGDNLSLARQAVLNYKEEILFEIKEIEEAKRELDYLKKVEEERKNIEDYDYINIEDLLFFENLRNKRIETLEIKAYGTKLESEEEYFEREREERLYGNPEETKYAFSADY